MGWDAMLFGDLKFPPGGVAAWKELVIEDGLYKDWKKWTMMGDPGATTTVAGLIAQLEDHARWCTDEYDGADVQHVTVDGDGVTVRAYINEDDFRHWGGLIATMMRVAEKVGGEGEYVAVPNDEMAGERLVIRGGKSHVEPIDLVPAMMDDAVEGGLPYRAILDEIMASVAAKMERVHGLPRAIAQPQKAAPQSAAPAKAAPKKPAAPKKKAAPKTKAAPKKPAAPKKKAKAKKR